MTTYKPILFSTEMVQAIREGRKTQTRRICKYQRNEYGKYEVEVNGKVVSELDYNLECNDGNPFIAEKHNPSDILWVRETSVFLDGQYFYKADDHSEMKLFSGWKPAIHMPKEAARIFLKVTNVRVERLQDISWKDAAKEGVKFDWMENGKIKEQDARVLFKDLWDSINAKKHPWEDNPWVWVYDFEQIKKPQNWPL